MTLVDLTSFVKAVILPAKLVLQLETLVVTIVTPLNLEQFLPDSVFVIMTTILIILVKHVNFAIILVKNVQAH